MDTTMTMQNMINTGQFGYNQPVYQMPMDYGYNNQYAYQMPMNYNEPVINYHTPMYEYQTPQQQVYQMPMNYGYNVSPYEMQNYNNQQINYGYNVGGFNNMIPIGGVNYNQPQNSNGYTFAPVPGGYGSNNNYNYYDPYGSTFNNQYNNYGYNGYYNNYQQYGNYGCYDSRYAGYDPRTAYNKSRREQIELMKIKYSIAGAYYGKEYTDEELEELVVPKRPTEMISQEEVDKRREYNQMCYYMKLVNSPPLETNAMRTARCLHDMSYNFHKEFDNHSLCQFLEEDLWKLQRENWLRKYIKKDGTRDLSRTYSSSCYNELLNMHRPSGDSYVDELLDTSRFDNNLDDMEIGLPKIFEAERRKRMFEGKLPTFISSEETQKRRHEWTNMILDQIYSKGGNK